MNSEDFLNYLKNWGVRYLAAGDKEYTIHGESLEIMFKHFNNSPKRVFEDFLAWVEVMLKQEDSAKCPQ